MEQIKQLFEQAGAIVINTGAGMGRDSGLKDFRGEDGVWGEVNKETGANAMDIANPAYMDKNPLYVWQFMAQRMLEFATHEPHEGFYLIQKWIARYKLDAFCMTSNIDGYFQRAGYHPEQIREVHGSLYHLQCSQPCGDHLWPNDIDYVKMAQQPEMPLLPRCPKCGIMARPNIYMFCDNRYIYRRSFEQKQNFNAFLERNRDKKKIVMEIGSGPHVQTIRIKTREMASQHGATIIRINPKDFRVRQGHISIAKSALQALREIDEQLA